MSTSESSPLLSPRAKRQSRVPGRKCRDVTLIVLLVAVPLILFFSAWKVSHPGSESNKSVDQNPFSIPGGPDLPANVGRLPFLGYNTWNSYHCDINESVILETAELMVKLGFKDLGYNYVNIDDCYSEKKRSDTGEIIVDKTRFPSGMRSVVDKIHALGLKAGIYSDSGWYTCQMYPGSYLHEEQDVRTFQGDWDFDLLKYDNCAIPFDGIIKLGMVGKFSRMANAITDVAKELGKTPMLFSLCQWGREQPWLWARHYGQAWRTTDDIGPNWDAISSITNQATRYAWATDFYGHNDLDILEVGNSQTFSYDEAKSHFTIWALLKSPLLIGADLAKLTKEDIEIYSNKELIGINQDPVYGKSVTPFRWGRTPDYTNDYTYPAQYWSMQSEKGTVFMLLNVEDEPKDMTFTFVESPWTRAGALYSVRDLWTHTDNGTYYRNFTAKAVPRHGVVALLLQDVGEEPEHTDPPCAIAEWCTTEDGTIVSGDAGREHDKPFNPYSAWQDDGSWLIDDTKVDLAQVNLKNARFGKAVADAREGKPVKKMRTRREERMDVGK